MCSHGPLIFNAACLPNKVIYGRNAKCGVDTRVSRHLLKHSARTYCTPAFTSKHSLKLFRKQRISHLKTIQSIMSTLKKQGAKEKGIPKNALCFFMLQCEADLFYEASPKQWFPLVAFAIFYTISTQIVFQLYFSGQCHTDEDLLTAEPLMKTAVCTGCKAAHFSLTVYECNHNSSV